MTSPVPAASHAYAAQLLICCAVGFACFFGSYLRIPVVPLYAAGLGASTSQVGAINAAFMFMAGLLSIPAGLLSDRLGRRAVILGGLLVIAGSSFLLYLSTTPGQMFIIYLLFGIGLAAFSPSMMSCVADVAPRTHLGRAYGWYTLAVNVAMMLGPAAGGFLASAFGLRLVFLVSGGLILAMFFVTLALLHPSPSVLPVPAKRLAVLPDLRCLGRNRPYRACLLATAGGCVAFGMFMTFVPLYVKELGMHAGHVGLVFAAQATANGLSRIPFGRLSDQVADRSTLVQTGLVGVTAALALLGLFSSLPLLLVCAAGLGLGMGIAFTAIGALIADVVPHELRGLAMGGYSTCIYLSMMLSAASMGGVIGAVGYGRGFILAGAASVVLTLMFRGLYRKTLVGVKG
jgi:MFS family permease